MNPLELSDVSIPKKNKTDDYRSALTLEQAQALLQVSEKVSVGLTKNQVHRMLVDRALVAVLLYCGLRSAELSALNRVNMQYMSDEAVRLTIRGKGNKERFVTLDGIALERVQEMLEYVDKREDFEHDENAVFVGINGKRIGHEYVGRAVHRISLMVAQDEDLKQYYRKVVPHGLRHTAATLRLLSGASLIEVRDMLGHADISTTSIYLNNINSRMSGDTTLGLSVT